MQEEQQGVAVLLGLCAALLAAMVFAKWITERPTGSADASIFLQPAQPTAGTVHHEKESFSSAPPSGQITQIQTRLIQLGYLLGRADGVWGARSQSAFRRFKSASGLPVNDLWGEETSAVLFSRDAVYAPAPAASHANR
jgi:peptidoglycan hydrolase-like protein with peptidoglycan-binding domain